MTLHDPRRIAFASGSFLAIFRLRQRMSSALAEFFRWFGQGRAVRGASLSALQEAQEQSNARLPSHIVNRLVLDRMDIFRRNSSSVKTFGAIETVLSNGRVRRGFGWQADFVIEGYVDPREPGFA